MNQSTEVPLSMPMDVEMAINLATDGALHALFHICKQTGWTPHVVNVPEASGLRMIFMATDAKDKTCYFDSAVLKPPAAPLSLN
jgi:hypothetical protein